MKSKEENVKLIKVDNEGTYKLVIEYFMDWKDAIEVKENDLPLKNIKGNIYGLYVNDVLKYIGER